MSISVTLPEVNIPEDDLKILLAIKLLDEGLVSLGKASEIAGYSEKAFVEILFHKGIPPIKKIQGGVSRNISFIRLTQ